MSALQRLCAESNPLEMFTGKVSEAALVSALNEAIDAHSSDLVPMQIVREGIAFCASKLDQLGVPHNTTVVIYGKAASAIGIHTFEYYTTHKAVPSLYGAVPDQQQHQEPGWTTVEPPTFNPYMDIGYLRDSVAINAREMYSKLYEATSRTGSIKQHDSIKLQLFLYPNNRSYFVVTAVEGRAELIRVPAFVNHQAWM